MTNLLQVCLYKGCSHMKDLIKLVTLAFFGFTLAACNQEASERQGSASEQTDTGTSQDGVIQEDTATDQPAPTSQ